MKRAKHNERDSRMAPVSLAGLLSALTLALVVGCSEAPEEPQIVDQPNTTDEFGGYTATNEAPAFGSPELMALEAEETGVEYSDPLLATPAMAEVVNDPEARAYAVRIIWGKLRADSTVTTATDWSGSLTVNRGAEVVRRVIRFEPATDELLPRTDRRLIEWRSLTTVHNDGLLVEVFNPLRPDSVRVDSVFDSDTLVSVDTTVFRDPLTLTFATAPLTVSFTGAQLRALDTIIYVQDSCAVLIQSTQVDHRVCPRGYLAGRWGFTEDGRQVFRGAWMSARGEILGHLMGHWGVNDAGERTFWGKWIADNGRFEGFVRGRWEPHPDCAADEFAFDHAGGWFGGVIFSADRAPIGELRGRYDHESRDDAARGGRFAGKWRLRCPNLGVDDGHNERDGNTVVDSGDAF